MIRRFKTWGEFKEFKEAETMDQNRKAFLFDIFREMADTIKGPFRPRYHFEVRFEGGPSELAFFLDLKKHPAIKDVDVRYTKGTVYNIGDGHATPFGHVDLEITCEAEPVLETVWDAVQTTWPQEVNEWREAEKTAQTLRRYSAGVITRAEAMREIGLDVSELDAFVDLMNRHQISWPKIDRERAEQEGELVAAAIALNAGKERRIEINPRVMRGKPVVRGTRITVELIVKKLGEGITEQELLAAYPNLSQEDIDAAVRYAEKRNG